MRALSIGFAGGDGVPTLQAALNRHGPAPYEARLHAALGDLYLEKERYQDAAEAYRAYRKAPADGPGGAAAAGRVPLRRTNAAASLAGARRQARTGRWLRSEERILAGEPRDLDPRVSAAVEANLLDLAQYHHALAQARLRARTSTRRYAGTSDYPRRVRRFARGARDAPVARRPAVRWRSDSRKQRLSTSWAAYCMQRIPPLRARATRRSLHTRKRRPAVAGGCARGLAGSARRFRRSVTRTRFPDRTEVPAVLTRTDAQRFRRRRPRPRGIGRAAHAGARTARRPSSSSASPGLCSRTPSSTRRDTRKPNAPSANSKHGSRRATPNVSTVRRAARRVGLPASRGATGRGRSRGAVERFLRVAQRRSRTRASAPRRNSMRRPCCSTPAMEPCSAPCSKPSARSHPQHELAPTRRASSRSPISRPARTQQAAIELERVAAREGEDSEIRRTALWQAAELYAEAERPCSRDARVCRVCAALPGAVRRPPSMRGRNLRILRRDAGDAAGRSAGSRRS